MSSINPYLNFSGNCEEAFDFYKGIFGGELEINRFSEMPPGEGMEGVDPDMIMHVSLPLGDEQVLMGSDVPGAMGPVSFGNSVTVSIGPASSEEGRRIFDGLSEGGNVTMPYAEMFWGAEYGACTDKFGINWMVNYTKGTGQDS